MTYSIVAHDPDTALLGIAVQSKFPGVAGLICHGRAGVGVVATQAFSNPDHGRRGLALLELGVPPEQVLDLLTAGDDRRAERQVAVMAADGARAAYLGDAVRGWTGASGARTGEHCLAHGNSLMGEAVLDAMVAAFEGARADFCHALIVALRAGEAAGGELRGVQSAGLQVFKAGAGYGGRQDRHVDISIYDHADPIGELARCYDLHRLSYFPSDPADLRPIDGDLAEELSRLLIHEGYLEGQPSAAWDENRIAAMARFMGAENYDNRIRDDNLIDLEVLADIRSRRGGTAGSGES